MALTLPLSFKKDLESQSSTLIPVVVIGNFPLEGSSVNWHDYVGHFSTSQLSIPIQGIATNAGVAAPTPSSPILTNIPSLKESIDIEKRNYKIGSISVTLSNLPYEGKRFSEIVNTSLINLECRIFWLSPSTEIIYTEKHNATQEQRANSAFQMYYGVIRRYEHNDSVVTLTVEDKSQEVLHKDLATETLTEEVENKYKNKPIPMVYGKVDRSPALITAPQPQMWQSESKAFNLIFESQPVTANYDKPEGYDGVEYSAFLYINEGTEYYRVIDNMDWEFLEGFNSWQEPQIAAENVFAQENPNAVKILGKYRVGANIGSNSASLVVANNTIGDNVLLVDYVQFPNYASPVLTAGSSMPLGTPEPPDGNSLDIIDTTAGGLEAIYDKNKDTFIRILKHFSPKPDFPTAFAPRGMGFALQFPSLSIDIKTVDERILEAWFNETADTEEDEQNSLFKLNESFLKTTLLNKIRF